MSIVAYGLVFGLMVGLVGVDYIMMDLLAVASVTDLASALLAGDPMVVTFVMVAGFAMEAVASRA